MTTNIIDILGINTLALRGKGTEFNRFSRFFQSVADARESVQTGDYVPTPGLFNAVLILGVGIAVYSFDLEDFVAIEDLQAAGNQANRYIELDGADDYIHFDNLQGGTENVLDWTKNWSLGITLVGLGPVTSDQQYVTLATNGENNVMLRRGGTNWGIYVTSNWNNGYQHGANTWVAPSATSRIMLTYEAATRRLKYYLGEPATGTFALKANLGVQQSVIDTNGPAGELCIGKRHPDRYFGFYSYAWDGGFNNLLVSDKTLTLSQVTEYFQTGEGFTEHEYYPDITTYARLGEDTYPEVVDSKGNATGELINGAPDDFVDIPEE